MSQISEKISDIVSAVTGRDEHFNSVIIVAAGSGTRMGSSVKSTKQMTDIAGMPVVVRTILQFEKCDFINEIVVVARADEIERYSEFTEKYKFKKITKVVAGGETRRLSVLEGFKAISEKNEYVAIHDGARCLITPEMIADVFHQAYKHGCAAAACRPKDTVKRADKSGIITETINRDELWQAQTPQIFRNDIYRAAAYIAHKDGFEATDDCMLAENIGFKVKLVDCGYENLKITTRDDLYFAEAILKMREDKKENG